MQLCLQFRSIIFFLLMEEGTHFNAGTDRMLGSHPLRVPILCWFPSTFPTT